MSSTHPRLRVVPPPTRPSTPPAAQPPRGDSGGSRELGDLYEEFAPYVGAIALRLLGRPDDVDDVVQDVFLAAHRGLRRRETDAEIKGWLATVTVRTARRRLRRMRVRGFFGWDDDARFDSLAAPGASPEQRATIARVYEVLEREPIEHRLAWLLRKVEGHSMADVAERCGCSLATAKRRVAAATVALEEAFGHE